MSDLDKWIKQQRDWGFDIEIQDRYKEEGTEVNIYAKSTDNFRGYIGFVYSAYFDKDGNFLYAGVWE